MCSLIFTQLVSKEIKQLPIDFTNKRVELTREYIKAHYGLHVNDIDITPKIIFIHYTGTDNFDYIYSFFKKETLSSARADIANASSLNVSAHFLVKKDGTIFQLMPPNKMARHVIGLNYNSIGIENMGGKGDKEDLTKAQLEANLFLIKYLQKKYPSIEYVAGHYEYRCFEKTPLWLEKNKNYRTLKKDPGKLFMDKIKKNTKNLKFAPCK